MLGQIKL